MKKITPILLMVSIFIVSCSNNADNNANLKQQKLTYDTNDRTQDFYDNEKTHELAGPRSIEVIGEISNPGVVSYSSLPLRSVIVKETLLKGKSNAFVGAYRYDGYSLYDILNKCILNKKNAKEFPPIIDLFVEVINDKGEKVVFSWGELYYPIHRHEIIIATQVMHIVPSKSKDLWPLPEEPRLIVASDLITERNISNPTKIIVKTISKKYDIKKGAKIYGPVLSLKNNGKLIKKFKFTPKKYQIESISTIFYGRGRGIHGTTPFKGVYLKSLLADYFEFNKENIQRGIFCLAATDGYHGAFTYSEIMNRNDNLEFLLIDKDNYEDAGKFSVLASPDFFSDRAIKSMNEIDFSIIK